MDTREAEWICAAQAGQVLVDLANSTASTTTLASRLRKSFNASQTHLLLEQLELRQRGKRKFAASGRMFFTRVGLEQATDQWIAAYKAKRFEGPVADLCCGIGGDLIALATQAAASANRVTGVDQDRAMGVLAAANVAVNDASADFVAATVSPHSVTDHGAWHADPDRRSTGRRTTHIDGHSPDPATLDALHARCPHAAIKLAPAAQPPAAWCAERELNWISRGGECRQLVVWSGRLARDAGRRVATALGTDGSAVSFSGDGGGQPPLAGEAGRYLCEPDPAVLAAGLDGDLAIEQDLQRLTAKGAYYTGSAVPASPLLSSFEILDHFPLRPAVIAAYLRQRSIGVVEIKHRGLSLDPVRLRQQLKLRGDRSATLLATTLHSKPIVYFAQRIPFVAP